MSWDLIEHKSAPVSDRFDFTGLSLGAYKRLVLLLDDLKVGTDGAFILLQLSTATVLRTSGYRYRVKAMATSGTTDDTNSASAAHIRLIGGSGSTLGIGNASQKSGMGKVELTNLDSGLYKLVTFDGCAIGSTGSGIRYVVGGILEQTGAIDAIRILLDTGTLTGGQATLYGMATS